MPYRVVQPWGKDRTREATEISVWATIADAFAEIDRYAVRVKASNVSGDRLKLLMVDDDGREVRRRTDDWGSPGALPTRVASARSV